MLRFVFTIIILCDTYINSNEAAPQGGLLGVKLSITLLPLEEDYASLFICTF